MKMNQPQLNREDFVIDYSNAYKDIKQDKKEIVHYVSSEDVNGKGQHLPINGYKDELFRSNPIVLFNHGVDAMWNEPTNPKESLMYLIAMNMYVNKEGNFLKAGTKFKENNEFAMDIFDAYNTGFLNTWSKRWRPISKVIFDEEGNITVNEWSMREYSSVFIPADDGATTLMQNSINDFKSDIFKNYIKDFSFVNAVKKEVEADSEIIKLRNEFNDLKKIIEEKPSDKPEIIEYINNAINLVTDHNQKRFLEIAGSINNLGGVINKRLNKFEGGLYSKIADCVAGVIRKATGQV